MKREFINKINNQEYISQFLYDKICQNYREIIPTNFNLDDYNNEILNEKSIIYKDYFDNMYNDIDPNIHLDTEQIKSILADEEYSLIIAGAGTGKTTTMASKVKYLVDIKGVDPSKIVVMSYTKKATEELEKRILVDFGIPAKVTTFHSLGLMYIREIFKGRKCYIVDDNKRKEIFCDYFKNNIFPYKNKINEIVKIFNTKKGSILTKHFIDNYEKFETYDEYFNFYKKEKINEIPDIKYEVWRRTENRLNNEYPITINNEFVKSKGEAIIANFLYKNGINYNYEKIYSKVMNERRIYRPDFTLDLGGEEVYIEYFGYSTYTKDKLNRYNKIKKIKEEYHKTHNTKFIGLDYDKDKSIVKRLRPELLKLGFKFKPKTDEELLSTMLDYNYYLPIEKLQEMFYKNIDLIKTSNDRKHYYTKTMNYISKLEKKEQGLALKQFEYINDFYLYYQDTLFRREDYGFDFSDMIYYANKYINNIGNDNNLNFEYLIIDEYQDISQERYEFAKNIANKNNSKVVAVGDDWQSIYAFAGSRIDYIYNFKNYFKGSKLFKISNTYRNSQKLINYSGNFIMKNDMQIKKDLISSKNINHPIKFIFFENLNEYETLKKLILKIHKTTPKHNILILARTNYLIQKLYKDIDLKKDVNSKIKFVGYDDIDINGMTMHSSKGLTADEVILIGLDNTFPMKSTPRFWLENLFRPTGDIEKIPFAEERRLFYVALTRTKNFVYLLVNKNSKYRSPFISELYNTMIREDEKIK